MTDMQGGSRLPFQKAGNKTQQITVSLSGQTRFLKTLYLKLILLHVMCLVQYFVYVLFI